jgi:NADH-quinone oxidoreductase subunit K
VITVCRHYLTCSAILFSISVAGHLPQPQERDPAADVHRTDAARGEHQLHRVFALLGDTDGQVFVFFILTVAAAEAAIGLAILVVLFRNRARSTWPNWTT